MKKGMGQAGDLIIKVFVEKDAKFTRDQDNIISEDSIPFSWAALGTNTTVNTIKGLS